MLSKKLLPGFVRPQQLTTGDVPRLIQQSPDERGVQAQLDALTALFARGLWDIGKDWYAATVRSVSGLWQQSGMVGGRRNLPLSMTDLVLRTQLANIQLQDDQAEEAHDRCL